jgi:cytochrome c-type biogenesis protein
MLAAISRGEERYTMDSSVFFGGSVIAATVAGVIALFAPCCISVMLPAYFAGSFQNRRALVAMTFLFAAGVATVILPLAMGASALRQLFTEQHTIVYVAGGLFMLGLGAYTLGGGQLHLPMPGRRAGGKRGPLSVYSLGVFSGVASSCCAPVLAGVIALSSVASSFGLALGLGAAYVFGMVAPLFVISLLWERYNWRSSRLFRPRSFTYRVGPLRRTITGTNLAGGILLAVMGAATLWVGIAYDAMPASSGWQARVSAELQRYGQAATDALSWVPGWAAAIALLAIVALLAWRALGQVGHGPDEEDEVPDEEIKEKTFEQREA